MYHFSHPQHGHGPSGQAGRRGVVLLVVIAMLTLFSVVALSFVFYAEAENSASLIASQSFSKTDPDVEPELLLSYFMSQLVYGTTNQYSVLRGHSLQDTKFGSMGNPAYSGIGRLHYKNATLGGDDYYYPNYQYFPADGFIRDPEYYGTRNPTTQPNPNPAAYHAGNAPYTYPDMNNMFLARVDIDGTTGLPVVVAPSFHRLYLNSNSTNKYAVLFPTTSYNPNYNPSESDPKTLANVRNLGNSQGFKYVDPNSGKVTYYNNDSYWLDLGFPYMIAPNGTKYKPLFAPLVVDLDNRLNMFVAGNNLGGTNAKTGYPTHLSNRGYTPTEINWKYLYDLQGISSTELASWLTSRTNALAPGSYPPTWPANIGNVTTVARDGPHYARVDINGQNGGTYTLPAKGSFLITPTYPAWYTNAPVTNPPELASPWIGYNPYGASQLLGPFDAVLRHRDTGVPAYTSTNWFASMPTTFANASMRSQLTPWSWTMDAATGAPYIPTGPTGAYQYNAAVLYPFGAAYASPNFNPALKKPYVASGEFTTRLSSGLVSTGGSLGVAYGTPTSPNRTTGPTLGGPITQRIRVNLNRISGNQNASTGASYDYPRPDQNGYIDLTQVANQTAFNNAQTVRQQLAWDIYNVFALVTGAWDPNTYTTASAHVGTTLTVGSTAGFPPAGTLNIKVGAKKVDTVAYTGTTATTFTGVGAIKGKVPAGSIVTNAAMTQTSTQWQAARWLAQLAVNIVDYIDNDDINTPFTWFTDPNGLIASETLYGTEAPRLVLNEVYPSLDNDKADPGIKGGGKNAAATYYDLNVWAELHNPGRSIVSTTIGAASNKMALPQPVIAVASTTGLPTSGVVSINVNGTLTTVAYSGITATTLTGCTGGTGTLATGQNVNAEPYPQDLGMARLNVNMPLPTLYVYQQSNSKVLPPTNVIYVSTDPTGMNVNAAATNQLLQNLPASGMLVLGGTTVINYTGSAQSMNGNPAALTGCSLPVTNPVTSPITLATSQTIQPYNAAYQIVLEGADPNLRSPTNLTGAPTNAPLNPPSLWPTGAQVEPANGAFSDPLRANHGFYVVGPSSSMSTAYVNPALNPQLPYTYQSNQNTVKNLPIATGNALLNGGTTVLLRRLACPYIPPQPIATLPNYNPYITVDYVANVVTESALEYAPTKAKKLPNLATFAAQGRLQPYAASYLAAQPKMTGQIGLPNNTFFQHNAKNQATAAASPTTLTQPFNWLTQLDRPLINQLELLHVSGFRPHELTQQFVTYNAKGVGTPYQQYAPWTNSAAMIYRALDYLGVPSYLNGGSTLDALGYPGSNPIPRVPGRININTLNDPVDNKGNFVAQDPNTGNYVPPTFMALCDPNANSSFSRPTVSLAQQDVNTVYNAMITSRSQGPLGTPSVNDVPFRSFTAGYIGAGDLQYPNGAGLSDTLLRLNTATGTPIFELSQTATRTHPYQRYALMQKIFNNLTTTSEVFAVYLTVGFFQVDDSATPPLIQQEIGYAQGRPVRHRMFAIVDRSQLTSYVGPQTNYNIRGTAPPNNNQIVPYWTIIK